MYLSQYCFTHVEMWYSYINTCNTSEFFSKKKSEYAITYREYTSIYTFRSVLLISAGSTKPLIVFCLL